MSLQSAGRDSSRRVAARNPRRRQRLDTDSVGHQPQRKRSKVTSETFDAGTTTNGDRRRLSTAGLSADVRSRKSPTPNDILDVPLRPRRPADARAARSHTGAVLTKNTHYTLRQLSSTPDAIRNSTSDFRGMILSSPSLALVVTHSHAYIWDWTSPTPVNQARVFDVPRKSKPPEPLSLGYLVTNGASSSIGLVLLSPTSGEITFWENIDTAESLSLFRDRNAGIQSSLGGLFVGETIVDVTGAEHAGLIITLSSGRIAQVMLRNAQGKPAISSIFLSTRDGSGGGGLFSSLKGALGIGWRTDSIGTRTRSQGAKGQIQVISAASTGNLHVWDLAWSGHCSHRASVDFRELVQREVAATAGGSEKSSPVTLVDFAILTAKPTGQEVSLIGDESPIDLVFLAQQKSGFHLIEITLTNNKVYVERVTPLRNYHSSTESSAMPSRRRPRLLIPEPGHSAILVFHDAVAFMTLADSSAADPGAQLLMEAHRSPKLFQDVLHLRKDSHATILDAQNDTSDPSNSSAFLFVQGAGLTRLSVSDPSVTGNRASLQIKEKIEQAIVYGAHQGNFLDFNRFGKNEYAKQDAEEAAIAISEAIVSSDLQLLHSGSTSVESHITSCEQACLALVGFLRRHFSPVSRTTCWKLMADAEKLAAGLELWKNFDRAMSESGVPRPTVLPAVVKVVRSKTRGEKVSKDSELDEVRHWFTHDLKYIDQLCSQALSLVNNGYQSGTLHNLTRLLSECDDIVSSVYDTAYQFRASYADVYGINPANISDGVLEEPWEDLPEPWTATHEGLNLFDHYIDIARNYMVDVYEKPEESPEADDQFVNKVILENVSLVHILCRCYRERIAWCSAHYMDKYRNYAPGLQEKFKRSREHHLRGLVKIGQAGAGLKIAEKFKDMDTLVRLVMSETAYLVESKEDPTVPSEERAVIAERMDDLQNGIRRYFRDYGVAFANPFFDNHLAAHRSFGLLKESSIFTEPLTEYLRAEPARGRLGWINEILNKKDLVKSQAALQGLARDHEAKLWNKKIELSLSKLALFATAEAKSAAPAAGRTPSQVATINSQLSILAIQDAIYAHVQPTILAAVDHDAEVQLVSDAYAVGIRSTLPALHQLLEITFDDLLNHAALSAEQLIDLLTLMDSVPSSQPEVDIAGREFYFALKILDAVKDDIPASRFQYLQGLIWKRCYLRDEWDLINKTGLKSEATVRERLRETTTTGTFALGLSDFLGSGSAVNITKPKDCIAASSTTNDLSHRFPTSDIRDPIVADNGKQDVQLQELIKKYNLEKWVDASLEEAKKLADEEAEFRLQEAQGLNGVNGSSGHSNGLNGSYVDVDGVAQRQQDEDEDEEDDGAIPGEEIVNPEVVDVMDEDDIPVETDVAQTKHTKTPRKSKAAPVTANGTHTTKATAVDASRDASQQQQPSRKSTRLTRSQARDVDNDAEMS